MTRSTALVGSLLLACTTSLAAAQETAGPSGTLVVANRNAGNVALISLPSGRIAATLNVGEGPGEVAVSPDGKTAVVARFGLREAGRSISIIDIARGKVLGTHEMGKYDRLHGVAFHPDGAQVLVTSETKQCLLTVEVPAGTMSDAVRFGQIRGQRVAVASNGRRAYVSNLASYSVSAVDLGETVAVKNLKVEKGPEGIAISPDGKTLWVACRGANTLEVIDTSTFTIAATIPCADFPRRLVFTPDGAQVLVSCGRSSDVAVFDAVTRTETRRVKMEYPPVNRQENRGMTMLYGQSAFPDGLAVSADGAYAFVANEMADRVVAVDLSSGKVVKEIECGPGPGSLAWTAIEVSAKASGGE